MTDIFDKEANANLLQRLEKLTATTQPLWGKMTASQMVWHCQKPFDVGTGTLPLKGGLLGLLFGKMAKNNFIKSQGFSKNAPTHPKFKTTETPEFDKEKAQLMSLVAAFGQQGPSIMGTKKHPFFGNMTDKEWGNLLYLHLEHHLKQFNL